MDFALMALACWRLSSLIANELGPFYMFFHIKQRVKRCEKRNPKSMVARLHLHELMTCEWCLSVWVGMALVEAHILAPVATRYITMALSLSALTIIIKYIVHLLSNAESYINTKHELIKEVKHEQQNV